MIKYKTQVEIESCPAGENPGQGGAGPIAQTGEWMEGRFEASHSWSAS